MKHLHFSALTDAWNDTDTFILKRVKRFVAPHSKDDTFSIQADKQEEEQVAPIFGLAV